MSPREKFRKSESAKGWNDIVDSKQFSIGADAALLHFMGTLQKVDNIESAAANEYRRQGATAFLDTLVNLNTETQQPKFHERTTLKPV